MRDEHEGGASLLVTCKKQIDDLRPGRLVEIASRLVGDQDRRVWREGAGKRYALLLAAGELGRIVLAALAQADGRKLGCRTLVGVVEAGKFERHGNVFQRRHGRNEVKGLKHDTDIAPAEAGQRVFVERVEVLARDHDGAGIGALQAGRDHEQSRLARSRGTDQADGLAPTYVQIDIFEDMNTGRAPPERQINPAQRDRRLCAP